MSFPSSAKRPAAILFDAACRNVAAGGRSYMRLIRPVRFSLVAACVLLGATLLAQRPLPDRLAPPDAAAAPLILDRSGQLLPQASDGGWNRTQRVSLEHIPPLLRATVVGAEDRHFWTHHGVDWRARAAAVAAALDPRVSKRVVSPSRLETLGACGLRYFYRYVLGIRPPDIPAFDPDVWLDPRNRGTTYMSNQRSSS